MALCFSFAVLADMSITGALLCVLYKGRAKQRRYVLTTFLCPERSNSQYV